MVDVRENLQAQKQNYCPERSGFAIRLEEGIEAKPLYLSLEDYSWVSASE